jgi:hypothetical protein
MKSGSLFDHLQLLDLSWRSMYSTKGRKPHEGIGSPATPEYPALSHRGVHCSGAWDAPRHHHIGNDTATTIPCHLLGRFDIHLFKAR